MYRFFLIASFFLVVPIAVADSEIQIVDQHGLTRALRPVESKAPVRISVECKRKKNWQPCAGVEFRLVNVDGLAPHHEAQANRGMIELMAVQAGRWKVFSPTKQPFRIKDVEIGVGQ